MVNKNKKRRISENKLQNNIVLINNRKSFEIEK